MTMTSDKKNALQILVRMSLEDKDYSRFRETFELLNPKLTDEDFKPMFPEGWSLDSNWLVESRRTAAEEYEAFRPIQLQIDRYNDFMAGCYD
jgi:hypothetical protein